MIIIYIKVKLYNELKRVIIKIKSRNNSIAYILTLN